MKGDIKLINCFGSVGNPVKDFTTKEVIPGSYRHSQTVGGVTYTWKCGKLELTGVVKLVEDTFTDNGVEKTFYRMEGLVNDAKVVTGIKSLAEELATMDF